MVFFPEVLEPLRALSNADSAGAESRTETTLDLLTHYLGCASTQTNSAGIDAIKIVCHGTGAQTVMTAWSLGPLDKASLVLNFHYAIGGLRERGEIERLRDRLDLFAARRDAASPTDRERIDSLRKALRQRDRVEREERRLNLHGQTPPPQLKVRKDEWNRRIKKAWKKLPTR